MQQSEPINNWSTYDCCCAILSNSANTEVVPTCKALAFEYTYLHKQSCVHGCDMSCRLVHTFAESLGIISMSPALFCAILESHNVSHAAIKCLCWRHTSSEHFEAMPPQTIGAAGAAFVLV
jgi:hypothetical protein